MVFLHGVAGSRATYDWLGESVAGHRVIRPDFRGHGAAERTPGEYLIADYFADVLRILHATGPAVLVGHSLGGVAAWWAAQRVPELVRGAFLEDPPLYRGEPDGQSLDVSHFQHLQSLAHEWQTGGVSVSDAAARLAAEADAAAQTPDALAARAYSLLHLDAEVLDSVISGALLAETDVESPVDVPVCVLAAGENPAFAAEDEQRIATTHPRVQVVRVADAGHSIHDERAHREQYFARVEAFVASI